jgi:hypothetical protein
MSSGGGPDPLDPPHIYATVTKNVCNKNERKIIIKCNRFLHKPKRNGVSQFTCKKRLLTFVLFIFILCNDIAMRH